MMTKPAPKLVFLIKSDAQQPGKFAHSGKYFLHNGRWHKLHADKPAPKGAPIAAHPHAAGAPKAPSATFSDAEWDGLKLPAENSNASTFNKQIEQLKAAASAGDVTGILGSGYGTNTYGKKLSIIANKVLEMLGSEHKVTPGQKPGAHASVQMAPQIEAGQPEPVESVQVQEKPDATLINEGTKPNSAQSDLTQQSIDAVVAQVKQEIPITKDADKAIAVRSAMKKLGISANVKLIPGGGAVTVSTKTYEQHFNEAEKKAIHMVGHGLGFTGVQGTSLAESRTASPNQINLHFGYQSSAQGSAPKEGETKQGAEGTLVFKDGRWHKQGEAAPVATDHASSLSIPAFQEGKTVSGVVDYYTAVAQKVLNLAAAGDASGLEQFKADGMKPNKKGKVSNTWAGKTANSKMLLDLHAKAMEQVKGGAQPAPAEGAKDEAIQAAVDHLKEDAKQPGMPAGEAAEDKALVQKLEAAQGNPAAEFKVTDSGYLEGKDGYVQQYANKKQAYAKVEQMKAAGYEAHVSAFHPFKIVIDAKPGDNQTAVKQGEAGAAPAPEQKPAAEVAPVKKEPRLVIPTKAPALPAGWSGPGTGMIANPDPVNGGVVDKNSEGWFAVANMDGIETLEGFRTQQAALDALAQAVKEKQAPAAPASGGDSKAKLDQIPWDKLKIPDTNSNAKSHNGKVDQIKAMAYAGDIAGLEAFKAGKNTYGKKQNLLAQTAIAALKEGGAPASTPAPEVSAKPAKSLAGKPAYDHIAQQLKAGGFADQAAKDWMAANPGAWDELNDALKDQGFEHLATFGPQTAGFDDSPKEGDTKQGADGMLVFKNGRWHKVEQEQLAQPQAAAEQPAGIPEPPMEFSAAGGNPTWAKHYATVAKALHEKVLAEGAAGLKGIVTNHSDGRFTINIAGFKLKKVGPNDNAEYRKQMHAYVSALKASVGKPKKVSKPKAPKAPEAPVAAPNAVESMDNWVQTGPQGGSNPGGRFKDPEGVEWYCKFPADEDTAKAEVLAAKLYAALGIAGQDAKLITKNGKVGIASRWQTVSKASSPSALAKADGVAAGFGADAWLGNWDVVGLGYDNLQLGPDGKAMRVDAGGSLMYRAQGGKKAFGNVVTEIDSLRDAKINPQAAAVFGGLSEADITASVAKVVQLPDASIRALCFTYGPGSEADRKALAETLIARKADLMAKFPKAGKTAKKRLDPNNLPIDPSQLPKRHDFDNWNGPGKGLSSQPHVNAANQAVEQEILELAKTGNLTKLKDFHFHEIDKSTGNATGKMVPIKNHPSKHVVQFHADVVQLLDEIANPPEPLKHFVEADIGTLDALSAAFPPKPFGTTVDSVKSNEKMGFWVVLGGISSVAKMRPKKTMEFTKSAIDAAHQKYKEAKSLAKHFINSVQASGSYNDLFRNGKEYDGAGHKLSDVAKAALEVATEQPEGTSLYRWQNMSDAMVQKIMGAPDGTVFQATGPMCTSYSPTATSGFGQHRVTVRYAKGAKAVESFGSGAFKGEKEVTTLPNARFVILSKKMVPNEKVPGKQRLELEVLMLPPDLGINQ